MTTEIRIEDCEVSHALEITAEVAMWKIPKTLGDGWARIKQQAETSGAKISGAPYARYLGLDWDEVRKEGALSQMWHLVSRKQKLRIGMPTAAAVTGAGDIHAAEIAAGRYATAMHTGALHKIGQTYKKIAEWAAGESITLAESAIENYLTDPADVATDDLQTLIFIQVLD